MEVITIENKNTNCYLIPSNNGWIMIDTGLPDTFPQLLRLLSQKDIPVNDVNYLLITHYHPNHAGLTQNLKDLGTNVILHEYQIPYVQKINALYKKNPKANFKDIVLSNNLIVSESGSRELLKSLGVDGEIIPTPGHSDDSVSLLIDDDCAFIGDLPKFLLSSDDNLLETKDSWNRIKSTKIKTIYPSHGEAYSF